MCHGASDETPGSPIVVPDVCTACILVVHSEHFTRCAVLEPTVSFYT